jgi:hypothetical protein
LLVVSGILVGMLQGTLRNRRQLHSERNARQADFLLQAGMERAEFQLSTNARYQGEIWQLPSEAIIGKGEGRVTIEISPRANSKQLQIQVAAEYPLGDLSSVRRSRTFLIPSEHPSQLE